MPEEQMAEQTNQNQDQTNVRATTKTYPGTIVLKQPLAHGSDEHLGVDTKFRRIKVNHQGRPIEVPVLSGNAIRGTLRRIAAADFLRRVGYTKVSDKLYYALFSGGSLEKGEGADIEVGFKRDIRGHLPFISLFGTAIKQQMVPGRLKVGMGVPVAVETQDMTGRQSEQSVFQLLDEIYYTRRDDLEEKKDQEHKQQMKYTVEVLTPGTELAHHFTLEGANEVEEACFHAIMQQFLYCPTLGGMSAIGHGLVEMRDYGFGDPQPYFDYLEKHQEAIREFLDTVQKSKK